MYSFVGMGPVCKVSHATSSLLRLLAYSGATNLLKAAGVTDMLNRSSQQSEAFGYICDLVPALCSSAIYFISDSDIYINNAEKMQVFMAHYPSGSSLKSFRHFKQLMLSDKFAYFDYGDEANRRIYGQSDPPSIDITKIHNFPIALISGHTDELSNPKDV